jgi:hypothetical protein
MFQRGSGGWFAFGRQEIQEPSFFDSENASERTSPVSWGITVVPSQIMYKITIANPGTYRIPSLKILEGKYLQGGRKQLAASDRGQLTRKPGFWRHVRSRSSRSLPASRRVCRAWMLTLFTSNLNDPKFVAKEAPDMRRSYLDHPRLDRRRVDWRHRTDRQQWIRWHVPLTSTAPISCVQLDGLSIVYFGTVDPRAVGRGRANCMIAVVCTRSCSRAKLDAAAVVLWP